MKWTDDLAIGVELIDTQHMELFSRIDNLLQAMKNKTCKFELGPTLAFLEEYVVEHFSDEQALMQGIDYPEYEAHREMHDGFIADFAELKKELQQESGNFDRSAYVNKMVVDWIVDHIKKVDTELGDYISKYKGQ